MTDWEDVWEEQLVSLSIRRRTESMPTVWAPGRQVNVVRHSIGQRANGEWRMAEWCADESKGGTQPLPLGPVMEW